MKWDDIFVYILFVLSTAIALHHRYTVRREWRFWFGSSNSSHFGIWFVFLYFFSSNNRKIFNLREKRYLYLRATHTRHRSGKKQNGFWAKIRQQFYQVFESEREYWTRLHSAPSKVTLKLKVSLDLIHRNSVTHYTQKWKKKTNRTQTHLDWLGDRVRRRNTKILFGFSYRECYVAPQRPLKRFASRKISLYWNGKRLSRSPPRATMV